MRVQVRASDGSVLPHRWDFQAGQAVRIQDSFSVGAYTFLVDGQPCPAELPVRLRTETDVILRASGGGCEVAVTKFHSDEEGHGFARINGRAVGFPAGTVVQLRSLDDPSDMSRPQARTDESGHFLFAMVTPGRYALEVTSDGYLIGRTEVDVGPDELAQATISVDQPVPSGG
jgi:hypothetical protein